MLFTAISFCIILTLNFQIYPYVISHSKAFLKTSLTKKVNASVTRQLTENYSLFSDLVTLKEKADGSVSSLNVNNADLLIARATLVSDILNSINYYEDIQMHIPAGNITGISILSDKGPTVNVSAKIANGFNAYFENEFQELGINQTLYSIYFTVRFEVDILLPAKIEKLKIEQSFPVMSTVIVGNIPDAYTEIHRLTQDITEEEIDDIYDFGAY